MERIRAHSLPLLALFACFATVAVAKPLAPLPERNPERPVAPAAVTPEAAVEATGAIKPEHDAEDSSTTAEKEAAPAEDETESAEEPAAPKGKVVTDMPLPDPNPNRVELAGMKGTLAPAIATPTPKLDFAEILKPLLKYEISSADERNVRRVMGTHGNADSLAAEIDDSAARAFALWYKYRNGKHTGRADAIEQFRVNHPDWPGQDDLREKAEARLFLSGAGANEVKMFFGPSPPQTGAGKAALAGMYLKEGNETEAHELVVSAWRDHQLNSEIEKKILDKFGMMITDEHHRARIDKLLYPDDKRTITAARRIAKLLPASEQKKIDARIAVIQRGGNAGKLLSALPDKAIEADAGLRFNNIQWLRRTKDKERREQAWKLLLDAPSEPNVLLDLNNWWEERRVSCRGALTDGLPKVAYDIAANHGLTSGDGYIEAEFMAGWIALRFLSDPNSALRHFLSLRRVATSSKNIARGEYWLGRTALALGDRGSAVIHFHGAAKYPQYFYGQLGRQALDAKPARLEVTLSPLPNIADVQSFMSRDGVRAIGVARAIGMEWVTPQFFLALSRTIPNPAEIVLLAELAKAMGRDQIALRLAKIAFNRDLPLGDYALPVGVIPEFKSLLDERVDPALVHALSRQESEFNAAAKSPVGAAGLMQLMPATARMVARQYKVQYSQARLTNAAYNTQLGEAFLSDLIENYNGSYFLALVAYNAGGGRVADWIKAFGDPRDPDVDPIDWIELIPFTETRHYVFKIMETLQLYRSRLSGPQQALQLVQDLNRGRRIPNPTLASAGVEAKAD